MASYADVVNFEVEKPSCNIIRLVKSGEFYRAYNHSAWLFQCCIAEHKVMRKYVKALKCDVFYVGFPAKSLFAAAKDCGLPIGNLSSQLFSNVYMNVFDQYVKRTLRCKHYGRYVDDAFIVSGNRAYLKQLIPVVTHFLKTELGLEISPEKTRIYSATYGVEFLGAYIKPFRTYVSTASLKRIKRRINTLPTYDMLQFQSSANSYLGVLSHYDSYCLRRVLFGYLSHWTHYGRFANDWLRFTPFTHN